jgi:hypothetical protein
MNVEMRPGGLVKIDPVSGICDLIEKAFGSDGGACHLGRIGSV